MRRLLSLILVMAFALSGCCAPSYQSIPDGVSSMESDASASSVAETDPADSSASTDSSAPSVEDASLSLPEAETQEEPLSLNLSLSLSSLITTPSALQAMSALWTAAALFPL